MVNDQNIKKKNNNMQIATHIATIFFVIFAICLTVYGINKGIFNDQNALKEWINQFVIAAPIIFIIVQMVQVVIPVIPGGITCVIGVVIFGPWQGLLYNYIGLVAGSMINFFLARKYGKKVVQYIVKEKIYNKYVNWLEQGKKFDKFFFVAIFFPFAPDDILCLIAGLTKMTWKKFMTIITLGKPLSIAIYSFVLYYGGSSLASLFV